LEIQTHVHFPWPQLFQTIHSSLRLCGTLLTSKLFVERNFRTSHNPKADWPPLVGCLILLIQYSCSYPPYLSSPSATWGWHHAGMTGTHLTCLSHRRLDKIKTWWQPTNHFDMWQSLIFGNNTNQSQLQAYRSSEETKFREW
jgi:hypothetical protein